MASAAHKNMIDQVMDPNKFDRRTHIWDAQGRLIRKNLYTEYVVNGDRYLERPLGSGNLWTEGNQPAGRVEKTFGPTGIESSKKFEMDAQHKDFTPALEGDDKLHFELEQERARNAELAAELAAIRKERSPVPATLGLGSLARVDKPEPKFHSENKTQIEKSVPKLPKED